jgi:SAM-dependent methyltransferase
MIPRKRGGTMAKRVPERIKQLRANLGYIKPGRLVEFGCGSGLVLQMLSEAFPDSLIIGIDISEDALREARGMGLKGVALVRADVTCKLLRWGCVDTALFIASLHEVYSSLGELGVTQSLRIAFDVLREGGVLVIWDFLKPPPKEVEICFKNEETGERFKRFAQEFEPRKVGFMKRERGIILDIADALEFITKYRSPTLEDWKAEMKEVHFALSMEDYRRVLRDGGFKIIAAEGSSLSEEWWGEVKGDIECDFEGEQIAVLIVARKQGSLETIYSEEG